MEKMLEKIFATPGAISGVWVDRQLGDEPRGEHEYIAVNNIERERAINRELVEALEIALNYDVHMQCIDEEQIRTSLAKAKGESA